jgi:hypothetical protein
LDKIEPGKQKKIKIENLKENIYEEFTTKKTFCVDEIHTGPGESSQKPIKTLI